MAFSKFPRLQHLTYDPWILLKVTSILNSSELIQILVYYHTLPWLTLYGISFNNLLTWDSKATYFGRKLPVQSMYVLQKVLNDAERSFAPKNFYHLAYRLQMYEAGCNLKKGSSLMLESVRVTMLPLTSSALFLTWLDLTRELWHAARKQF